MSKKSFFVVNGPILFLGLYIVLGCYGHIRKQEITPFFGWSLFSIIPGEVNACRILVETPKGMSPLVDEIPIQEGRMSIIAKQLNSMNKALANGDLKQVFKLQTLITEELIEYNGLYEAQIEIFDPKDKFLNDRNIYQISLGNFIKDSLVWTKSLGLHPDSTAAYKVVDQKSVEIHKIHQAKNFSVLLGQYRHHGKERPQKILLELDGIPTSHHLLFDRSLSFKARKLKPKTYNFVLIVPEIVGNKNNLNFKVL